jgi:FkbM family methyltransferase
MSGVFWRIKLIKFLIDLNEKFIFERRLRSFYRSEIKGKIQTVIDIGANKGQSIDFFLKLNPDCSIYALEPNPSLFKLLQKKYNDHSTIQLFNAGISNLTGEKIFFENIFDYSSGFEELNTDSHYLKRKASLLGVNLHELISGNYPVNVFTLYQFIRAHNLPEQIDILKIDTEGHEYACLQGLFNAVPAVSIRYIQIENHNDDMYKNRVPFQTLCRLLEQNRYEQFRTIHHGFGKLDDVIFRKK